MMSAYDDLMAYVRQTAALGAVAERLSWDQEAVMPPAAAEQRGDEIAALEAVLHGRRTDPRIGEGLAAITPASPVEKAQLRLIGHEYRRAVTVPGRLAEAIARRTATAHAVWAEARAADNTALFLPVLKEILALKREEAACYASATGSDLYDALLDDFEPGQTGARIAAMFDAMRPRLVALREKILGKPMPEALEGHFPQSAQIALAREMAECFGYDFNRGRLDLVIHPFMSGRGQDVRITTRVDERDPFNCLYSTIHEAGHAGYELNIDPAYHFTPVGRGVSMAVHESQSRIYENQLGRSPAFCGFLHERMRAHFGENGLPGREGFARAVNRVRPGFIRTESDEVHYNLHVMLRFDLERALVNGALEVEDLEEAWNTRFAADFGLKVTRPSLGMLQDVHWSAGIFGYFPTYSLGNLYAGCLFAALRQAVPDYAAALAAGHLAPVLAWLAENVQRHGGLYQPEVLIEKASGAAPSAGPLLDYLEEKFGALYGL